MDFEKKNNIIININSNNKKDIEESKENKNINFNSIEKNKNGIKFELNNGQDNNYNLCFIAKRSYSCRINESKNKSFSNNENEEIKLNLNQKYMYLKTPQIKPKKSKLIPKPINIGSISISKKKSKFNLKDEDINIINDAISEGENEESNELSSDSSSNFSGGEEIKENNENEIDKNYVNEKDLKESVIKKLKSEIKKFELIKDYKIIEENDDDFDENGKISLRNLRKGMIQSKKSFYKNDNDIFNKIENNSSQKYKRYKDEILKGNENELIGRQFHKTTGFEQAHHKNKCPILEFLKRNSSSSIKINNK